MLTAADNSDDAVKTKIRIELNGEKSVIGQNNQNYGEPVAKPQHINEILFKGGNRPWGAFACTLW